MAAGMIVLATDGGREANRIRLVSLETLLAAKTAAIHAWAALDAQLGDLSQSASDVAPTVDQQNSGRARELLKEADRRHAIETQRYQLLQNLNELYSEVGFLESEVKKVRDELQETQQVLDGHWSLTLMPSGTKGDIYLSQNGTLVTGDYRLDTGQTGSLQGTFVNNSVVLERIDARYGKMGRFEGVLTKDHQSIKGTWYSYDFASGQPLTGAFSMDRTQQEEAAP